MERSESTIHISTTDGDFWLCVCGNQPDQDGFYPCNSAGNEVEPTVEQWQEPLYVCTQCGRIIHQQTLEVVGCNPHPKLF